MSPRFWRWARPLGGATVLALLVWRLGTGPFVDGLRRVDGWSLAAAAAIALVTTVCCAWRWSIVARGLGVTVPMRTAVAAYYQSQFLNTTLPGGVLGDVDRGVRHGRRVGDTVLGLRAVAWERTAGQVVQVVMATLLLLVLPSPLHAAMPLVATGVLSGTVVVVLVARWLPIGGTSLAARVRRTATVDVRDGLLALRAWPGIVLASTLAVSGHALTFVIAARTAGVSASPARLVPLALVVLLVSGIPANIAGWGLREGAAAWAFGAAGLGADQGVATAVVYGVMVLVASLPGAVVLLVTALRRRRPQLVMGGTVHG